MVRIVLRLFLCLHSSMIQLMCNIVEALLRQIVILGLVGVVL
eukprot:COSAG01_NODE_611_length_14848_cov_207.046308_18_plen_42_part_00